MPVELNTTAEQRAKEAEDIDEFSSLNLKGLKLEVEKLLDLIGSNGVFDEYTKHDIDHINGMLENLEWIIPEETQEKMTATDWLMTVLSIYFHDLGLLVTREEFEDRGESNFESFKEKTLYEGDEGEDYRKRIEGIGSDQQERFLYQEFVRSNHAQRIRDWINGEIDDDMGGSEQVVEEIEQLLYDLPKPFRRDLAKVCESHHLNDLDDLEKYQVSCPYGQSDEAAANLQYCAILLRSSDLLHITSDRAPSIMFRVINPDDPKGQEEWAKQEAVTSIRPKPQSLIDEDSNDEDHPSVIEVRAYFENERGFFALVDYLDYAEEQLKQCNEWVQEAKSRYPREFDFYWKSIDDTNIETEGFERETFEFDIDQRNILNLLTGHTLYNDTDVAIREIVQNSIDAIRVKKEKSGTDYDGKVEIHWNQNDGRLRIEDNGTGMTQEIIEEHLLTVGSSRYQTQRFKDDFPDFHPISEFGIGILSAFMIANEVNIYTGHEADEPPRQISFRSVHGRYLIRHLSEDDPEYESVTPHGTIVDLRMRPSADVQDIKEICDKWFLCPPCSIKLYNNDDEWKIGYDSLKQAMQNYIDDNMEALPLTSKSDEIKVKEINYNDMTVCYAVKKSDHFRDWKFVKGPDAGGIRRRTRSGSNEDLDIDPLGTAIEGIRVTAETPGYQGKPFLSMANLTGSHRPRTNVARTDLESGENYEETLSDIYQSYLDHVEEEVEALYKERSFSIAWAVEAAQFIIRPLRKRTINNSEILDKEMKNVPIILVERENERIPMTLSDLESSGKFWTVDSPLLRRADRLFRDMPTSKSYQDLVDRLELPLTDIPDGMVVCNINSPRFPDQVWEGREPESIEVIKEEKRIDINWCKIDKNPSWIKFPKSSQRPSQAGTNVRLLVQRDEIEVDGLDDEAGLITADKLLVFSYSDLCGVLVDIHRKADTEKDSHVKLLRIIDHIVKQTLTNESEIVDTADLRRRIEEDLSYEEQKLIDMIDLDVLSRTLQSSQAAFDPSVWFSHFEEEN